MDKRRKSDNINQENKKKNYYYLSAIKFSKDISNKDMNYSNLKLGESNNNLIFNKDIKDIHLGNFNSGRVGGRNSNKLLNTLNYGIDPERFYNKIYMSKNSVANFDHKKLKGRRISNIGMMKSLKKLSFIAYMKGLCFDKKGSVRFVSKFRKHLLSEEHLFKNHIKMVLMEKQVNNKNDDNTNVFECFNEL